MKRFMIAALVLTAAACTDDTPIGPVGEDADFHFGVLTISLALAHKLI